MGSIRNIYTILFAFVAVFSAVPYTSAAEKNVTIGTAGVTGVYYPAGGSICRMVNRGRKEHGIHCAVESTGGSIANLESIHNKELELGIVQSDLLYYAYNGKEIFSDAGMDRKLRVLLSLHFEPFTIVARKNARINVFDDLKGKRIYIGPAGSGMRATMEELITQKGLNKKTFANIVDVKSSDQTKALCEGKIDALVYAGGHPNGAIQQVTSSCATTLVSIAKADIEKMVATHPFYVKAAIPGGMYNGNTQETRTFGVRALLVASADLGNDVAYETVKAVFENLDNFKTLHPVFSTLEADYMVANDTIAPIHTGAEKYYREKGMSPAIPK
ncbi:MAG: TAXI family TRAP transporter solute-binding subunit [Rickettsiales bacterium]